MNSQASPFQTKTTREIYNDILWALRSWNKSANKEWWGRELNQMRDSNPAIFQNANTSFWAVNS